MTQQPADASDMLTRYANDLQAANHRAIHAESRADAAEAKVADLEKTIADELASTLEGQGTSGGSDD